MKRRTAQWVLKAEEDMEIARSLAALAKPKRDGACFHCQQAAEKYLKALLQETGRAVPRTHELEDLLDLLLPHDATLAPLAAEPPIPHALRGQLSLSRRPGHDAADANGATPGRARAHRVARSVRPAAVIADRFPVGGLLGGEGRAACFFDP